MSSTLYDLLKDRTLLVSAHRDGQVLSLRDGKWTATTMQSPRGMSVGQYVAIACGDSIRYYREDGTLGSVIYFDGKPLDPHAITYAGADLIITSPARSALVEATTAGVDEIWRVPGVDESTDGRSHVNGVCVKDGVVNYATALAVSNTPEQGWRVGASQRGGVVIDTLTNEIVLDSLMMPHSPVWHADALWFLNSGDGKLCKWIPRDKEYTVITTLTGFSRGLCFLDDSHVAVGVSQGRMTAFPELTIDPLAQPGIAVIDITTGRQAAFESLDVQEVFEIALALAPLVD